MLKIKPAPSDYCLVCPLPLILVQGDNLDIHIDFNKIAFQLIFAF